MTPKIPEDATAAQVCQLLTACYAHTLWRAGSNNRYYCWHLSGQGLALYAVLTNNTVEIRQLTHEDTSPDTVAEALRIFSAEAGAAQLAKLRGRKWRFVLAPQKECERLWGRVNLDAVWNVLDAFGWTASEDDEDEDADIDDTPAAAPAPSMTIDGIDMSPDLVEDDTPEPGDADPTDPLEYDDEDADFEDGVFEPLGIDDFTVSNDDDDEDDDEDEDNFDDFEDFDADDDADADDDDADADDEEGFDDDDFEPADIDADADDEAEPADDDEEGFDDDDFEPADIDDDAEFVDHELVSTAVAVTKPKPAYKMPAYIMMSGDALKALGEDAEFDDDDNEFDPDIGSDEDGADDIAAKVDELLRKPSPTAKPKRKSRGKRKRKDEGFDNDEWSDVA